MKHNMNRVLSIVALLMLTIGAWAEAERVNITATGGQVEYSISGTTCTLTATPNAGNYLTVENLTAVKVISGSVVQAPARRSIEIDENVTITPTNASADPSGVTTYTFPMPTDVSISVNVTAVFQARTSIANASITLAATTFTYDGEAKEPAVSSVVLRQTTLNAADYEVSYSNNTNAGTATVTVTGKRTYTGTATTTFTIKQATFTPMVTLESWTYGSAPNSPSVQNNVSNGNVAYSYAVRGTTNFSETVPTAAGEYTVKVTIAVTGNYEAAEATADFAIIGKTITDGMVTIEGTSFVFNNDVQVPNVTVTDGTNTLGVNDYAVSYEQVGDEVTTLLESANSVVNAGDYNVVITGKGNYTGTVKKSFKITKASIAGYTVTVDASQTYTYTGSAITPSVTVKDTKDGTLDAANYTVSYENNVNAADAEATNKPTVTVTGTGNYTGTATATFVIAKATIQGIKVSIPDNLTYDGTKHDLISVTLPESVVGAKVKYYYESVLEEDYNGSLDLNCIAMYTFTETVPAETNAGYFLMLYKVEGGNNYEDIDPTATKKNDIAPAEITGVTLKKSTLTYNGNAQEVEIASVKAGSLELTAEDYTVSYEVVYEGGEPVELEELPVETGTYNVVVTGQGNFKGAMSVEFNITAKAITDEMVTLSPETFTYNGSAQTPTVMVAYKIDEQTTKTLTENTDYTISYQKVDGETTTTVESPTDAGEYNVVVTGKGNYSGTASATFTINAASIAGATIAAIADMTYVGVAIEPELTVTVTLGETQKVLKQGEDYMVEYTNNINVGTATATVTGTGNYTGTKTANFNITGKAITDAIVTLEPEGFTYDGTPQTPTVTVAYKIDEQTTKTLTENTDYTISYQKVDGETTTTVESPTDAGEYNVVVTGKGNYSGTASATFTIAPAEITEVTLSNNKLTYNGKTQEVEIASVKAGTLALTAEDYTVSYEVVYEGVEPTEIDGLPMWTGTYNVVVTGQGNFTGSASATFTIVNRTLDITKLTFHEGWTTFYSLDEELDLPAGYGAYVATNVGNGVVTLTQISCVPKNEPVLLNNATTTTTDNTEYPFNLLQYAGEDIDVDDMYYYGLHNGAFMRVTGTIPEGKIYLYAEEPNAPQLTIVIDGETTGINASLVNSEEVKGDLYDLQGRKVVYPKKGLYIKNGRKVVVNNK